MWTERSDRSASGRWAIPIVGAVSGAGVARSLAALGLGQMARLPVDVEPDEAGAPNVARRQCAAPAAAASRCLLE